LKGIVALEDGTIFEGVSFGAMGESIGEVVFNTSMTGYQEVLTDPSYASQIVTMTYPLVGNYGINETDVESARVQVAGFIVKEACDYPSNFASTKTLSQYLKENNIIGIEGIDTRKLTRHIRIAGAMKGIVRAGENPPVISDLIDKAKAWQGLEGLDLAKIVTCKKPYVWDDNSVAGGPVNKKFSVVAYDFGIKFNILRILHSLGCKVTVVPATTTAKEALAYKPDGIFLSNGPGDPAAVTYGIAAVKELIGNSLSSVYALGIRYLGLPWAPRPISLNSAIAEQTIPSKTLKTIPFK